MKLQEEEEFQEGGIWDLKQEKMEEKKITTAGPAEGIRKQGRILGWMMGFLMITIAIGGLTLTSKEARKARLPYMMWTQDNPEQKEIAGEVNRRPDSRNWEGTWHLWLQRA